MEQQKDNNQQRQVSNGQLAQRDETKTYQGFGYIVRKSEKLTTALYLVTDIMPDREPMKWKVREVGIELLSDITVSSTSGAGERMSVLRGVTKKIERVVAFLEVAESTHMISAMNSGMLRKEYLALKNNIEAEWTRTHGESKMVLTERFFDVPRDSVLEIEERTPRISSSAQSEQTSRSDQPSRPPLSTQRDSRSSVSQLSHVTEQSRPISQSHNPVATRPRVIIEPPRTPNSNPFPRPAQSQSEQKKEEVPSEPFVAHRTEVGNTQRPPLIDRDVVVRPRPEVGSNDRRKIIFALIQQKPSLTVKDIAKSIQGVSEKTIQRELLAMVAEGVLVKRGERRWSTYSLPIN
jgi:hypothetical protein